MKMIQHDASSLKLSAMYRSCRAHQLREMKGVLAEKEWAPQKALKDARPHLNLQYIYLYTSFICCLNALPALSALEITEISTDFHSFHRFFIS